MVTIAIQRWDMVIELEIIINNTLMEDYVYGRVVKNSVKENHMILFGIYTNIKFSKLIYN